MLVERNGSSPFIPTNLMIILKPDKKIQSKFSNIDFRVLSLVYSILFDNCCNLTRKRNYTLTLKSTVGLYSYYSFQRGTNIRINISEVIFDEKQFHDTLVHEFRHFLQDKALHIPWNRKFYDDTTDVKYLASPAEIDADNFAFLVTSKVKRMYNRLVKFKADVSQFKDFKGK